MAETPRTIGKYEILDEIGQGAMGTVYRARDPVLERVIALKTIVTGSDIEAEARERFLREARSVARLQHPNIITIFELGEVEGMPFIAMEYLDGESLAEANAAGRPEGLRAKLETALQLCRGLGYAHGKGVIHRDIKPSNIFLLADGTTKVLDFGIAWLEGGTFATRTGMLLGTPAYMAPEQFSGEAVDHRVDMWAVGVILYEMLTGERPFDSKTVASLIYKIVHTDLPELGAERRGVTPEVVAIVKRSLQKSPDDRYADLAEMGRALRAAIEGRRPEDLDDDTDVTRRIDRPAPADDPTIITDGELEAVAAPPTPPPAPAASRPPTESTLMAAPLQAGEFRDAGSLVTSGPLQVIAVSPDERLLAVGGVDGALGLWNLETRVSLRTLRSRDHLRTGHSARTTALAFSADGGLLASGHLDGSIYLWDAESGLEMEGRLRHDASVAGLAFNPDASALVSGGHDATMKYWEVAAASAGDARRQMRRQPADVTTLAMSPSGDAVVTGHTNRALRVHDPESGRLTATLHGLKSVPSTLALSLDGGMAAVGCRDGALHIFRLETRALLRSFEGHGKAISSVVFFGDGRHLASVAMDHEVAVWEVSHDDRIATLPAGAQDICASVVVLDRTRRIVCGFAEGQVHAWEFG